MILQFVEESVVLFLPNEKKVADLLHAQVSRCFRNTIDASLLLKYIAECFLTGVVEGPITSGSLKDRLKKLKKWRKQCQTLDWELIAEEDLDGRGAYRLKTFGPIYCEQDDDTLTVVQPGSKSIGRPEETQSWTLKLEEENPLVGFACDHSE